MGYSCLVITVIILFLLFITTKEIEIADPNLKLAILNNLNKSTDIIYSHELKNVVELDASNYEIKSLMGIEQLYNLRILDLSNNYIQDVSPLSNLRKLETLNLYGNGILDLNKLGLIKLKGLKHLKEIDLGHNVKKEIIDDIEYEERLEDASLLGEFKQLKRVFLRDNYITDISWLSNLKNLRELDISENLIPTDDLKVLSNFIKLKKLDLSYLNLTSVKDIAKIKTLTKLNINNNFSIKDLELIENLSNLQNLKMSKTNFNPKKVDLTKLKKLNKLDLSNNNLTDVKFLKTLENLKELNLSYNKIKDISLLNQNIKLTYNTFNEIDNLQYEGVPIIYIDTNNVTIDSKTERVLGTMKIVNSENSNYPKEGLYEGYIGIRGRGNWTWTQPKKPYNIELWNDKKTSISAHILDLPFEEDWLLIPNYMDKTLLRNYTSHTLANLFELGWTPKIRFVEVYLNNEYQGLYQLTERIKRDNNRLPISKLSTSPIYHTKENITGGYILRSDRILEKDYFQTEYADKTLLYQYPKQEKITASQKEYIQNYINEFEQSLYVVDIKANNEYLKYIDIESFIKYFLIVEFSKDWDAVGFSEYMHKERGEKLKMGPIWDFDLTYGNSTNGDCHLYTGWTKQITSSKSWYRQLLKNDYFYQELAKYWEQEKHHFKDILTIIDKKAKEMNKEIEHNFERWAIMGKKVGTNPTPCPEDYEDEIEYLKTWIINRYNWLDKNLSDIQLFIKENE